MPLHSRTIPVAIAATLALSAVASAETEEERQTRILAETKLIAIMELAGPVSQFKDDGDPTTLEIVFLTRKSDGPSRVSDNGEVIFLYKASDKTQQKLIAQSFEIRFARAAQEATQ